MRTVGSVGRAIIGLPILDVSEIAATLLQQAVNGIEQETLLTEDLVRIGQKHWQLRILDSELRE